jgi:hypothetical protein
VSTQAPKESGSKRLFMISAACACISAGVFWAASLQAQSSPRPETKAPATACGAPFPGLAKAPAAVRGRSKPSDWLLFDQRTEFAQSKLKIVEAPRVPGGLAGSVQIDRAGVNAYDIGVSMRNQREIKRGENLTYEVWLQAIPAPGRRDPIVIEARIQEETRIGFTIFQDRQFTLTSDFQPYSLTFAAPKDFCPGKLNIALHLATGAHIVDIGPGMMRAQP